MIDEGDRMKKITDEQKEFLDLNLDQMHSKEVLGRLDPTVDWKHNFDLIKCFWNEDFGRISVDEHPDSDGCHKLVLITGGWSENEEIIEILRQSWFWGMFWAASFRGGKYILKVRTIKSSDET